MAQRLSVLRDILSHPLAVPFYLPAMLFSFANGMLIPTMPLYAASFDISYGLIGLILAGELIGIMIGDIPAGIMVNRTETKRTILIGLGFTALLTAALFGAQTVLIVMLLRLSSGFSRALFNISQHTFLSENILLTKRGRAIALYGGAHRVGIFVGPAVGGTIAAVFGLRTVFLAYGLVLAAAFTVVLIFLKTDTREKQKRSEMKHLPVASIPELIRDYYRILIPAGSGQLLAQMLRSGRQIIVPLYGAGILGLDAQAIGLIVSIGAAIDMFLFYPAGWIMDNLGRKYALVPTFTVQACGMALVPFAGDFAGLALAGIVMGLGNGLSAGTIMTLGADIAPVEGRGSFLGLWRLIGDGGSSGAPIITGAIADLFQLQPAAWALALAGVGAAAVFAFFVPETLQKQKRSLSPGD